MGQKVNPHGLRVGVIKDWDSRWYADKKNFARYLVEDKKIRDYVKEQTERAGVSRIEIERLGDDNTTITITTGKPGIIIGRGGSEIENLKKRLSKKFGRNFYINVKEVRNVDVEAQLVAESIARQLEERVSFRRAMKQAINRAMKNGARGIKTMVSGRLGGAEIARFEQYREGSIPLHTLHADIDYGFAEAKTSYGQLGVKVWIYKGEVRVLKNVAVEEKEANSDVNA
ncbi:MAG: 30S ribosomal protein S3 [Clostridiaceae bacterium]|jgi:small subunit ribosomal protein S3|nr:30S ribosomal protein S3 [Clostridiales bacterium]MDD3418405.1 30S ribosomal protein S3 [Eubacteriales bacterium]MDD3540852.1 30S ribosomal protein S3 [Eubacteriales bacterium]MDY0119224.1 30S ribosomal protein S3 [Clostridia bacterium]NLG30570.1 30S ribosomal protein S3 [Clostridiaceae bacterium]